jgi:iron(III) transport system ATP-binding protein
VSATAAASIAAAPSDHRPSARLSVVGLVCALGGRRVLDGLDLQLTPGEVVAILGPSGSGKTTLLRLLAGLEWPDAGTIDIDGERVSGPHQRVAPHRRGIGMVFQRAALWPHLRLRDNVALAMPGVPRRAARRRAVALLKAMGVGELAERFPDEVSGGEARRVALARAMAGKPRMLLLDEPLSNLDAERKVELRALITSVRRDSWRLPVEQEDRVEPSRTRSTQQPHEANTSTAPAMLWVTHDPEEAAAVADRVLRLERGRLSP